MIFRFFARESSSCFDTQTQIQPHIRQLFFIRSYRLMLAIRSGTTYERGRSSDKIVADSKKKKNREAWRTLTSLKYKYFKEIQRDLLSKDVKPNVSKYNYFSKILRREEIQNANTKSSAASATLCHLFFKIHHNKRKRYLMQSIRKWTIIIFILSDLCRYR